MRAYGSNMPKVLADIQRETRWERRRPVGPFGSTLQLLKPQFADTLESVLNKQLNAFVVETFEDKKLLFNILSNHNMRNIPIVVAEYDMFDYSSGEPDEKYLTCLRALKFNDEWVKRQLITSNKIEKMLLMEDRQLADEIMMSKQHNIDLCFTSEGYKVGGKQGMKTESIDPYRGPLRFQKDLEGEIRKYQAAEREIEQKKQEIASQVREVQATIDELQKRYRDCKGMERRLEQEIQRLEQQIEEKAETLKEDDPVDLTIFEEEIRECEEKIRQKVGQFQDIQSQKNAMLAETKEVMKQFRELETQELEREKHIHEFHKKLEKLEALKREAQDAFELINTEKQTIKLRYETKYNAYVESQRMAEEWTRQAQEDYPERVETQRSPRDIEKDIGYHQELAKNMEDQMGVSAEELRKQTFEILKQWNDADSVVKGMEKLSRSLKKMLSKRVTKWEVFRQYISTSAAHYFSYYLHMRGDEGKLRFNHDSKKLDIRVSTGDQYVKGSRQKDSRSLSGGEKSFSQISFLLSLWQSISSPVICLDEFDVFMDAINRKQTMKMIMNAASENSSQYILITPQDASNMDPGPYVTVHRLPDPERH
jgi:chromosome segregation ATPase